MFYHMENSWVLGSDSRPLVSLPQPVVLPMFALPYGLCMANYSHPHLPSFAILHTQDVLALQLLCVHGKCHNSALESHSSRDRCWRRCWRDRDGLLPIWKCPSTHRLQLCVSSEAATWPGLLDSISEAVSLLPQFNPLWRGREDPKIKPEAIRAARAKTRMYLHSRF